MRTESTVNILIPPLVAVAIAALLVAARDRGYGPSLLPTLLALAGGFLTLHSLLALHSRQTRAFLVGLELAYSTLLLLRSQASPLLGLDLSAHCRLQSLTVPATLALVYTLGHGRILGAGAVLSAWVTVTLPLLAALLSRWFPQAVTRALDFAPLPILGPVPQLGLALLSIFIVLLAVRSGRSHYDLTVAVMLLPRYLLLGQGGAGLHGGFAERAVLVALADLLVLLYSLYRLFWRRAFQDELTGLGNRRSFEEALRTLPRRCCVAMIDIDHFKSVNDTYGHAEGDNVLRWVAARIRAAFGTAAFRYGGEEFAVLLPEIGDPEARERLEQLRRGLAEDRFVLRSAADRRGERSPRAQGPDRRTATDRRAAYRDRRRPRRGSGPRRPAAGGSTRLQITVSIGTCTVGPSAEAPAATPADALRRADAALYQAKEGGRNRLVAAGHQRSGRR